MQSGSTNPTGVAQSTSPLPSPSYKRERIVFQVMYQQGVGLRCALIYKHAAFIAFSPSLERDALRAENQYLALSIRPELAKFIGEPKVSRAAPCGRKSRESFSASQTGEQPENAAKRVRPSGRDLSLPSTGAADLGNDYYGGLRARETV